MDPATADGEALVGPESGEVDSMGGAANGPLDSVPVESQATVGATARALFLQVESQPIRGASHADLAQDRKGLVDDQIPVPIGQGPEMAA
jgi:hypothetical protein